MGITTWKFGRRVTALRLTLLPLFNPNIQAWGEQWQCEVLDLGVRDVLGLQDHKKPFGQDPYHRQSSDLGVSNYTSWLPGVV